MTNEALIFGTRKGLLVLVRKRSEWVVQRESFLGIPIPYAVTDPRMETLWDCLSHGHWGPKLQRSSDGGAT
jgi:hypothetical protein